jgi:uncharacterized protein (TIGR03435 family)
LLAQQLASEAQTTFEVASLKENKTLNGSSFIGCAIGIGGTVAAGRCRFVNASLRSIIAYAYDLPAFTADQHVEGLPGWAISAGYDIDAAASDPNASEDQLKLMTRGLLADRFQLKLHEVNREVPGYSMVVAKGGLKAKSLDEAARNPSTNESSKPGLAFGTTTMPGVARALAAQLGRPVIDRTNITGRYALQLRLGSFSDDGDSGPSLFTALEEQLGLKLESQKVPSRILVIDHVEKPSLN